MLQHTISSYFLYGSESQEEILEDYEDLEVADIYAALAYAAKLAQTKRVISVVG